MNALNPESKKGNSAAATGYHYEKDDIDCEDRSNRHPMQRTIAYMKFDDKPWTKSYLVDRLKLDLAMVEISVNPNADEIIYDKRYYYNKAHHFLKIGAFKPVPHFPISVSDLSPKLSEELGSLDRNDRKFVLKQAVGRIFEDINCNLYHNSISRVLEVILVD